MIDERQYIRLAALAGVVGPLWLGGTIAALTVVEYEFLRSLRWHPIDAPTVDWPSGLALGPQGIWMVAAFVGGGALLPLFAWGLQRGVRRGAVLGPLLLGVAGVALALLGFKADPTFLPTPRTWQGSVHDLAFVLLGLTLFPAMLFLAQRFRGDARWRGHAGYTLATLLLAAPAFALKGAAFYLFLLAIMLWFVATGLRLATIAARPDQDALR
ncbi:MAG: DUF998 domain-containing protein [Roseiflexaceae bacterium]|nr:DUF998 domain-containing protein [Roseiflexaceae bacterium]